MLGFILFSKRCLVNDRMFYTICNHVIIDIFTLIVIVSKTVIPCAWFKGDDIETLENPSTRLEGFKIV